MQLIADSSCNHLIHYVTDPTSNLSGHQLLFMSDSPQPLAKYTHVLMVLVDLQLPVNWPCWHATAVCPGVYSVIARPGYMQLYGDEVWFAIHQRFVHAGAC